MYQVGGLTFPKTGHLLLDLSFNELLSDDVPELCDMLASHPMLHINIAHNRMEWADLRNLIAIGSSKCYQ